MIGDARNHSTYCTAYFAAVVLPFAKLLRWHCIQLKWKYTNNITFDAVHCTCSDALK